MTTPINIDELKTVLLIFHRHGYGSGNQENWIKEPDGSTSIRDVEGMWSYWDRFYGGEPYGGDETLFFAGRPFWMMVYYGKVFEGVDVERVYKTLRKALIQGVNDGEIFRGPALFIDEETGLEYRCFIEGDLEDLFIVEQIREIDGGHLVYKAKFIGGPVDQRRGD